MLLSFARGDYMAYTQLLNSIIEESGKTLKDIAKDCEQYGVKITPSYLSALRKSEDDRTPSNDVSLAIAKACNVSKERENILIIQAYLDKAPKEFEKLIEMLRNVLINTTAGMIDNKLTTEQYKVIKDMISEMPMAELVISLSSDLVYQSTKKQFGAMNFKTTDIMSDNVKIETTIKPSGIPICDDGMSPKINKGDQVNFEVMEIGDYKTGDTVLLSIPNSNKKQIARQIIFDESRKNITLLPINAEFQPKQCKINEIIIFGKITQVIKKL